MRGGAEWKPKLRWLIRRMRLLSPSRRPLESPSRMAARMPARWRRIVRREPNERDEPGAGGPCEPGVEVGGREPRVVELVEQPQLLFEQKGAVERLVGERDFAEQRELRDRLLLGCLEQRPAGALDPTFKVRRLSGREGLDNHDPPCSTPPALLANRG
jgi:hypothetical protein